jgi:RsiW-degrading membrane proteinase PrsW (M82 family)
MDQNDNREVAAFYKSRQKKIENLMIAVFTFLFASSIVGFVVMMGYIICHFVIKYW